MQVGGLFVLRAGLEEFNLGRRFWVLVSGWALGSRFWCQTLWSVEAFWVKQDYANLSDTERRVWVSRIERICVKPGGEYLVVVYTEGKDGGEDEAGSAEGDDVHPMDLREELHRTTDDDGDENLGKNDEEIKDSHVYAHFG
jgi:hypothetical protein